MAHARYSIFFLRHLSLVIISTLPRWLIIPSQLVFPSSFSSLAGFGAGNRESCDHHFLLLLQFLLITRCFVPLQKSVFSLLTDAGFSRCCLVPLRSRPRTRSANISRLNHVLVIFSSYTSSAQPNVLLSSISLGSAHCWTLLFSTMLSTSSSLSTLNHISLNIYHLSTRPAPTRHNPIFCSPLKVWVYLTFFPGCCLLPFLSRPRIISTNTRLNHVPIIFSPAPPRHNPMLLQKSVFSPLLDSDFSLCCFLSSLDPDPYQPIFQGLIMCHLFPPVPPRQNPIFCSPPKVCV